MKRAVVTGASGFIGRHLVGALREAGWATTTVSRRSNSTNASHYVLGADPWEITSLITMLDALSPDVVFHMAGTMRAGFASDMYMTNTILAARLLDAVERSQKRPSVVLAGSAAEYGIVGCERMPVSESEPCNPVSDYAVSKYAQTLLGLARSRQGAEVVVARIFNPIGSGMPSHLALANFAMQIRAMPHSGGQLYVGNLNLARDFMDVRDAAECIARLGQTACFGQVVNICSGHAYMLSTLVAELIRLSGRRVEVVVDAARRRVGEMEIFVGDNSRLSQLGIRLRQPKFDSVLPLLLAVG